MGVWLCVCRGAEFSSRGGVDTGCLLPWRHKAWLCNPGKKISFGDFHLCRVVNAFQLLRLSAGCGSQSDVEG